MESNPRDEVSSEAKELVKPREPSSVQDDSERKKKEHGLRYRLAGVSESPLVYLWFTLVEWYIINAILLVSLFVLALYHVSAKPNVVYLFVWVPVIILLLQTLVLLDIRRTAGYCLYMADRAATPAKEATPLISFATLSLRSSLRGVARMGRWNAGSHFEDAVLMSIHGKATHSDKLDLHQMLVAIELGAADMATRKPRANRYEAFQEYRQSLQKLLDSDRWNVSDLADFLVSHFTEQSASVKKRAESKSHRSTIQRIEEHVTLIQLIASLLLIAIPIVVAIVLAKH